ncbi:MAG: glycoside hydrolase family 2 TIM barrel-domain containing protein [Bacteroidota bacterium]
MRYVFHIVLIILCCLCIINGSCTYYTAPSGLSSSTLSLDGVWSFKAAHDVSEEKILAQTEPWDTLSVPGNWDTRPRYSEYVGKGYYKRTFRLPKAWSDKQIRIAFKAVYQTSKVWVNGQLVGTHTGGYLPFEYNITDQVRFDQPNEVVVMADNTYQRGAWWPWGGISRDVSIHANHPVRIVYQHIAAVPDFEKKQVQFNIRYTLENNGAKPIKGTIQPAIEGLDEIKPIEVTIPSGGPKEATVAFSRKLTNVNLWDLQSPHLYELTSTLTIGGQIHDTASDRFGIRKFEVKGEQFFLNNEPVRLNGVNRVHDHPAYGNTEPDALVVKDMQDILSLGCRFSRLMHAPLAENILDFCDENGFLLVEEIPVWGDDDPQAFPGNPLTKKWLEDLVKRDYNHPSVVAWSVGNELRMSDTVARWGKKSLTKNQYDYVNSMLDHVAQLDTTRLKTYVSITTYQNGQIGTEPYEKVDFISMNSYGNAPELAQKTHEKFAGKPIFISEIGKGQIGPAPDAVLSEAFIGHLTALKELPYVTGVSLWSYNDYRSNYKGTPASGFREWGVVSETREKKKAYRQLKEVFREWEDYLKNEVTKH